MELSEQNTSGLGINSAVPEEVKNHFNWGAFLLTWIWGIGNNTFLTLIIFVCILFKNHPVICSIVSIALGIWFGIKGNEWAWRNKKFASIEAFHNYQKKWVKAFFIIFVGIPLVLIILGTIVTLTIPTLIRSIHP